MILVAGENLIDFIPLNKNKYNYYVGGSALNTAVALGRLETNVYFCSQISKDFFGTTILSYLINNKVKTSKIKFSNYNSTIAIVVNKKKPDFNIYTKDTASINFKDYILDQKTLSEIKLAHFSSIGLALKPSSNTFLKLIKDIKKNKKSIISFDPNIRATIIKDKSYFIKTFKKILNFSDIVKMSDEDFKYLSKQDFSKQIRNWIEKYSIKLFILTLGAQGSIAYTKTNKIIQKNKKIKISDTVGAGDTFIAGIIKYLDYTKSLNLKKLDVISYNDLKKCLFFATKVAEQNCVKEGCDPPYLKKVEKFI